MQVEFLSWDGGCQPRPHPVSMRLGLAVHSTEIPGPWLCSDAIHWTESSPSLDSVLRKGKRVGSNHKPPGLCWPRLCGSQDGLELDSPLAALKNASAQKVECRGVVRAGHRKPAPCLPRRLLERPVHTEQSPRKAGVTPALAIPAYKTFWKFGFAFSLSGVLEMATDWTGPLTFSPFRWQVAFVSRFEENVIPCARRTYPAGCVRVVLCFLMVF